MELYQIKTEHPVVGYCESRIGGRSENQDSYGYHDTPFGLLIVVCDGMGGGPAGKTASSLAVSEILAGVMECEPDTAPKDVLEKAIQRANHALLDAIAENPELTGMGTTCTALLLNEQSAIMAHVGDSRIYQLRHHGKVFRTFDHSLVFDLVKQKVITEEQARLSDQSNIITRALGMKEELEVAIEERPYNKGDRFMLCTDGIHGAMPEKELMALATQRGELGNVVNGIAAMVDGNGKNNGGGHDNLTLVIVETKKRSKLKEKTKNKTTLILAIIAVVLAAVCMLLNGCNNKDIDVDLFSIEREELRPGFDSVYIEGTYNFFEDAEAMKLNISRDSTLIDASSHAVALTGKDYAVTVKNLGPNTIYYYSYSVNLGLKKDFITGTKHFRTLSQQQYKISVLASPQAGGVVSGGGTYTHGQQCTVTASANEGYVFEKWRGLDSFVSTDSIYSFTVTGDRSLIAMFNRISPEEYTISVSANPNNGGTVSGGGTYAEGQSCTVRATANTGYTFVNWTENGNQVSSDVNYTFTVNGNRTLKANFTAGSYVISVAVTPENSGTVTGAGGYEYGQSCSLRATSNTGYTFEKWTENGTQVSTNATYTFNVTSNRSLKAHFKAQSYTITASADPTSGGTITGGGTFEYGQNCTLQATASSGYTFEKWTENGNQILADANYTFTVTGNRTLVAHFISNGQNYTISVYANPSNGGSVSGGGTYQQGESCTVHATANSGFVFSEWTANGTQVSTDAWYTFTVTGNRTLVAHFTSDAPNYTINVSANPSSGGTVTGGGTYQQGQSCIVEANAHQGFVFVNWTENGNVVATSASYAFTVYGDRTLVANFSSSNYSINVSASPNNGGMVSGGGTYQYGQTCTIVATANPYFTFINWTENGNSISPNPNYSFTVTSDRTIKGNFATNSPSYYCATAIPFCTDAGTYEFPAGVNSGSGEEGPDYDCLRTTPNPAWYYMRIDDPGAIDIFICSEPSCDIDYCCWGPFTDPSEPCPNGLTIDKVVSCSYSASPTEHCLIPSTAQTGEYYIMVITNFSNQQCNIIFSKVAGNGSTDCNILMPMLK